MNICLKMALNIFKNLYDIIYMKPTLILKLLNSVVKEKGKKARDGCRWKFNAKSASSLPDQPDPSRVWRATARVCSGSELWPWCGADPGWCGGISAVIRAATPHHGKQKPGGFLQTRARSALPARSFAPGTVWAATAEETSRRASTSAAPGFSSLPRSPERGLSPRPRLRTPSALRHLPSATTTTGQRTTHGDCAAEPSIKR